MDQSKALGIVEILREALRIPTRNWKLFIPIILLILTSYSLLFLGDYFILLSLFDDEEAIANTQSLHPKFPKSTDFLNLVLKLKNREDVSMDLQAMLPTASYAVMLLSTITIIHASAATYSGDRLTLGDFFVRIGRKWKGPVITQLYVTLLGAGYMHLLNSLINITMTIADGSVVLVGLSSFIALAAYFLYLYLGVVWTLGLVISVTESHSGLKPLGKAEDLSGGRRFQGFVIIFLPLLVGIGISRVYDFFLSESHQTTTTRLGVGLILMNLHWLLDMFTLVAFTVFYYECKKSYGEVLIGKGDMVYSRIPGSPMF